MKPYHRKILPFLALIVAGTAPLPIVQAQFEDPEALEQRVDRQQIVVFGEDLVLKENETCRDVVVIGGNARIEGRARGDVVVVLGSATVTGRIDRDLVVVMGSADIAESARLSHDVVVVGGPLKIEPGAVINGARQAIVLGDKLPDLRWAADWFFNGALLARPLPPQFGWVWALAAVFAVVYVGLLALFPRPAVACVKAMEETPGASLVAGILAAALVGPLVFILIVSVAGILVIPVLILALAAALLFGKMAVYCTTGTQLGKQLNLSVLQQPLLGLIVGLLLFNLVYMVPVLGFLAWGIATVWGIGAVLIAAFGAFRRDEPPRRLTQAHSLAAESASSGSTESSEFAPTDSAEASPMPAPGGTTMGITDAPALAVPPLAAPPTDVMALARAGFWIRLAATTLDLLLLGVIWSIIGRFFLLAWVAYHIGMWTWKGTTIGGIVMSIKIVRIDGTPITFSVAMVRSLSSFFSAFALFIGFFWAGWDDEKQAWHDKIAGTLVVKVPKAISLI